MDEDPVRRIVRSHPVPDALIERLAAAPLMSEDEIDRFGETRTRLLPLTSDEVMALRAVGDGGLQAAEAAQALGCSRSAVQGRLMAARAKLGAKTTAQAIARAIRQDLI